MSSERKTFFDVEADGSTGGTVAKRTTRLYWLLAGIEMLANAIENESIMEPYTAEETAEIIQAVAWEASAELCAIEEAANKTAIS